MRRLSLLFCISFLLCFATYVQAQIIDISFAGGGVTQSSAWTNLRSSTYPGISSFPGLSPWSAPAAANSGASSATLNWASAGTDGGPFFSSASVYFAGFSTTTNNFGGSLRVSNTSPLLELRTLVFQLQIGEATGYDFYRSSGFPLLSLNGQTAQSALFTNLVTRYQNGVFTNPATGLPEPVYVNTWAYQWNLSPTNVSSYAVNFSAVTHAQVYALRVDGTTVLQPAAVVPEPRGTHLLAIAGLAFLVFLAKRYRQAR